MKTIPYKGHEITILPYGPGYSVKVSGPKVVCRAGTFALRDEAITYGKGRVDGTHDVEEDAP